MDPTTSALAPAIDNAAQALTTRSEQESEIITDKAGSVLRVELNRPAKKNAMTSNMYVTFANLLNDAAKDDTIQVVVVHGAGDSFTAGNDLDDFLAHHSQGGETPQAHLIAALIAFHKPLIAAVHGAAVGSGTTMLLHCDFVYAADNTRFQMPFINLALVPEFGSSYSTAAQIGYIQAAELFLLGAPFDARRAFELGFVTRIVSEHGLIATAMETARILAEKPAGALQATKRLLKQSSCEQTETAARFEIEEFASRLQSADTKEAIAAFFEKRRPDFTKTRTSSSATH